MPNDNVIQLAERFRNQLIAQDAAQLERLTRAYETLYRRLVDKIDLLVFDIGTIENATRGQVVRLARYKSLLKAIETEMTQYTAFVSVEISSNSLLLIEQAGVNAAAMLRSYGITDFATMRPETIETMLGFISPDGALFKRLEKLAGANAQLVADSLLEAVGLGYNPIKTAARINRALGSGLSDALRMARTAQLWTYRESTRANYANNADVVRGWIWWAELSGACMSCVNQHGKIFRLDQTLDDHHNGRCSMLPYVGDNPVEQSGADWFAEQPKAYQKKQMGLGKYEAYKSGQISIGDMTKVEYNEVYGDMKSETPLKDLI